MPRLEASSPIPAWLALVAAAGAYFATRPVDQLGDADFSLPMPLGVPFWGAALLVVLAAIPRRVVFGAEGLQISWLGHRRFVRFDRIVRAAPRGPAVVLTLDRGLGGRGRWRLTTLEVRSFFLSNESASSILTRLWQTVAAGAENGLRPNERAVLAASGRAPRAWVEALRAVAPPGAQYRQSMGLDLERLWRITENPAVATELRAGAAIALAATLDEDGRARLRVVAAAAVDPTLRAAMESVARAADVSDLEAVAGALVPAGLPG